MLFAAPNALYLLLIVPLLYLFFRWSQSRLRRRAATFGDNVLVERLSLRVSTRRDRVKRTLLLTAVVFLVLAIARPQWGQGTEEVVARGVDIFFLLDTSFSMDVPDVAPSRMERARYITSALMDRLHGNRIGLIVFSGGAFVQCPLTLDYGASRIFLDTVMTGIVPQPGTNIVAGLEAATRGFKTQSSEHRVVILLTDGEQLEGGDPVAAAKAASEEGIVIHAVGVGTPGGEPIPVRNEQGQVSDYLRDDSGQPVLSRLDEETLGRMAVTTGGKYFRISDKDEEIEEIADLVSAMEGKDLESQLFDRFEERFYWPLAFAILFLVAELALPRQTASKTAAGQTEEAA